MATEAEVRGWLENDYPYYARKCIKIVDQSSKLVPLDLKPAQHRIEAAINEQEAAGLPARIIVPKARREGVSTYGLGRAVWRTTTRPNRSALVVAHNKKIAGELHESAVSMVAHLPNETIDGLHLKPPIASAQRLSEINFGTKERTRRLEGDLGLNSSITVATAGEPDSERGSINFDLHLSEAAYYPDARRTMTTLLSTVPDEPGTLIIIESTANGRNDFYRRCKEAEAGESDYALVFLAWFEEPLYRRPFGSPALRDDFIESIGAGPWGDDEPDLIELMRQHGIADEEIWERLAWRRWAIVNRTGSDLRDFHQEYPATLEEAFVASAGMVFSGVLIAKQMEVARKAPSLMGVLKPGETVERIRRGHTFTVPTSAIWTPKFELDGTTIYRGYWEVWKKPDLGKPPSGTRGEPGYDPGRPRGQYIVAVDPASGEELAQDGSAYSAIEVIDHRTFEQVAEYRSREDADLIGEQAHLAALWYLRAWLVPEITGGYGNSIADHIWRDYKYPKIYFRRPVDSKKQSQAQRLGWQTTTQTKPMIENRTKEMLRTESSGINSPGLLDELVTYVRDDKGRTGPEEGSFADRYMSWGIAQQVAHEKPLESEHRGTVDISTRRTPVHA